MEELSIDPKDPNFSEEKMIEQFQSIVDDKSVHFLRRDHFEHLVKILKKHKFWETQPI